MAYYIIATDLGQQKLADAIANDTPLALTTIGVGDGGGVAYDPVASQSALINEVWSGPIQHLYVDIDNPGWAVAEIVVPAEVGGWWVREAGIYDDQGDLIFIIKHPETYKPLLSDGTAREIAIRAVMQVANAEQVVLLIDPAVVMASRAWTESLIQEHLRNHHRRARDYYWS
jgi:phage-related tail fiber protein